MSMPSFPGGIQRVDFEFRPMNGREGNLPEPVCMVAHNLMTNETIRLWRDDLVKRRCAPFATDASALFVAFYAPAEMNCFLSLGWPLPVNVLDLYVEFRNMTNGTRPKSGNGLLGSLVYFGLAGMDAAEKSDMQNLVLRGGPWTDQEREDILNYCQSDVVALEKLFHAMLPFIDWPRALLRGRYTKAVARMEANGTPLDMETLEILQNNWGSIQHRLIEQADSQYQVYEGGSFKRAKFERYLAQQGIPWPTLPTTGAVDLSDGTFRDMAAVYPQLTMLRELRATLSQLRLNKLSVGEDGRNRVMLSIFSSKTGRNQPSNSKFIFGPAVWIRFLIIPGTGMAIAYVDWSQQEFGIAAAISGDERMMMAYASGDPYLAFAKQAGVVPHDATKQSHSAIRDQFKAAVLAVQYGMGAASLATRINQPVARARQLLDLHRRTYPKFWEWSDAIRDHALLDVPLKTRFGWTLNPSSNPNERSLRNFPIQANGAEMLRLACIRLTEDGIRVCAPVHDALLVEAPMMEIDAVVDHVQTVMRQASATILDGFELGSDAKIVRDGERYTDPRGISMWNQVMDLLNLNHQIVV